MATPKSWIKAPRYHRWITPYPRGRVSDCIQEWYGTFGNPNTTTGTSLIARQKTLTEANNFADFHRVAELPPVPPASRLFQSPLSRRMHTPFAASCHGSLANSPVLPPRPSTSRTSARLWYPCAPPLRLRPRCPRKGGRRRTHLWSRYLR